MNISRDHIQKIFKEYTDAYDSSNEKIALKIKHTYRVAMLCERIARAEGMEGAEADLAWLLGMLHDIGRFEQLRRYDTFNDAQSVDHAALGADILFSGKIWDFAADPSEDALIETAVRAHSAYRIPEKLDARTEKFCHILRDADKIDILRVNIETPMEEIYNITREELCHAAITEEVVKSFYAHHATLRSLKRTSIDNLVGHLSLIYELVFRESVQIVKEQGYWEKLASFPSENPETVQTLQGLREEMRRFLEKKSVENACKEESATL